MPTLLSDPREISPSTGSRELLLVWQKPGTRQFLRAGTLRVTDDTYEFRYAPDIADDPDFFPLDGFPRLDSVYNSEHLPAFFANRVMSAERGMYEQYLGWLGLERGDHALAVEVLARTGGARATDTFHIIEQPPGDAHRFTSRFFVSGIRHQMGASERVRGIRAGDTLLVEPQPDNAKNADAHLILKSHDEPIGWVPDWLCGEVAALRSEGWHFQVIAEQVNMDAPSHVQVLCRVEASRS